MWDRGSGTVRWIAFAKTTDARSTLYQKRDPRATVDVSAPLTLTTPAPSSSGEALCCSRTSKLLNWRREPALRNHESLLGHGVDDRARDLPPDHAAVAHVAEAKGESGRGALAADAAAEGQVTPTAGREAPGVQPRRG